MSAPHNIGVFVEKILFLAHVDEFGASLPKSAYEVLGLAIDLAAQTNAALVIGLIGEDVEAAAEFCGRRGRISHPRRFRVPTLRKLGMELTPPPSRQSVVRPRRALFSLPQLRDLRACFPASLPASLARPIRTSLQSKSVMERLQQVAGSIGSALRLSFVAMRVRGFFCSNQAVTKHGQATAERLQSNQIAITLPAEARRTEVTGIRAPKSEAQTIRPDAGLLFVAGAGWTKKQSDGKVHGEEAESLILGFLNASKASLGGSKSLVDQSGEQQSVLGFMTHLNQVGQTGSTPRHPKGLSTCCHGEEPHVVGWRFIHERRAINLDPNCGWARGKADVLYVADAFAVMKRINEVLAERNGRKLEHAASASVQ